MRIQVQIDGGIAYLPGLAKPIILDTDTLPAQDADELKRLVKAARFFELPEGGEQKALPHGADYRRYTITVEDGTNRHTVHAIDPVVDPALENLLTFVEERRSLSH